MDVNEIAVATISLVRDAAEARLVEQALSALSAVGAPVAVADGGSPDAFLETVAGLGLTIVRAGSAAGLVGQARASLEAAAATGRRYLLYTESDKLSFFSEHLQDFLRRCAPGDETGVVIASRSRSSFETFPAIQQYTEAVANRLCAETTGLAADYFYGPFLVRSELIRHIADVPAGIGWGWRPYIFGLARRMGHRIEAIEGHYSCPADQRAETEAERLHRIRQLSQNLAGLVEAHRRRVPA